MSKNVGYFPHYINARNDRKIRKARLQLGIESYAIYFMTLEVLREQEGFRYPLEDMDILAEDFGTTLNKIEVVVMNYGLFELDSTKEFFSPSQIKSMQPYLEKLEHYRLMGKKSAMMKKKKMQQQIEELEKLSQSNSGQPTFNVGSTQVGTYVEQLTNNTNKLINKYTLFTFESFISHIRANYMNQLIIEILDKHINKPIAISVSKKGYLYNLGTGEDFLGSRAKELWQSLYKLSKEGKLNFIQNNTKDSHERN